MKMNKCLAACIACGSILSIGVQAADLSLPAEQIRQGEAKQQQIKVQTKQVAAQLQSIIEEFKRNGLAGQDVAVLEAIRSVLDKLSEAEMKKVIDALQEARSAGDDAASKRAFTGAVAGQKSIVVQLRTLLLEYQRQQTLYDLSLRLAALAQRQDGNMKNARDLAKSVGTRTGSSFGDDQKASLQIQHAEQQSIRDEVNPLLAKLETIYKESEGSTKERLGKALELVKGGALKMAMDASIESLKGANLYNAAGSEMTVRNQVRDLSRMIAPPKDALAALRQAAAEIEKAIEEEKSIIDETAKLNKGRPDTGEIESKQGDLVDRTEQIRKDVEGIAP